MLYHVIVDLGEIQAPTPKHAACWCAVELEKDSVYNLGFLVTSINEEPDFVDLEDEDEEEIQRLAEVVAVKLHTCEHGVDWREERCPECEALEESDRRYDERYSFGWFVHTVIERSSFSSTYHTSGGMICET